MIRGKEDCSASLGLPPGRVCSFHDPIQKRGSSPTEGSPVGFSQLSARGRVAVMCPQPQDWPPRGCWMPGQPLMKAGASHSLVVHRLAQWLQFHPSKDHRTRSRGRTRAQQNQNLMFGALINTVVPTHFKMS